MIRRPLTTGARPGAGCPHSPSTESVDRLISSAKHGARHTGQHPAAKERPVRFDDKVIFITGGGSGLGRECALWWAEAGGTIVVTDIVEKRATDVAAEIGGKGG